MVTGPKYSRAFIRKLTPNKTNGVFTEVIAVLAGSGITDNTLFVVGAYGLVYLFSIAVNGIDCVELGLRELTRCGRCRNTIPGCVWCKTVCGGIIRHI